MGFVRGTLPICSPSQHCSQWARTYLKYCLCNARDGASLTLGLVSVVSWGVAEVPQIITNYREKSSEGLSIAFLMTWIVGDLFNLIGCLLEPATLPTQYYMALLYTATTAVLAAQTIYYGHIYHRKKSSKVNLSDKRDELDQEDTNLVGYKTGKNDSKRDGYHAPTLSSSPIPVAAPLSSRYGSSRYGSSGRDLYYMSARSLSKSPKPTVGSWLAQSRDSGRTPVTTHSLHSSREPLLGELAPALSAPVLNTKNTLCVVSFAALFLGTYTIRLLMNSSFRASPPGMVIVVGRKLLQDKSMVLFVQDGVSSGIGSILGWVMAAIYLGGRLPQICLNIRRGNVEGLSPLMFIFALIGNSTYVGSILVNSMEWSRIKPNLPWLVDAGGCVILDAFIVIQFIYFHYRKTKDSGSRCDH